MKLTERQAFCMTTAFLLGNVLASIGGITKNSKTGYISVLFAYLFFLLLVSVYRFIFSKNNYLSFFEISKKLFGNLANKIVLFIIAFYSFFAAFMSIFNYLEFIEVSTYYKTPKFAALVIVLLLILYLCYSREKAMGRYAEIILPIILIAIIILFVSGIKDFKPHHLENIRLLTAPEVFRTGMLTFLTPFAEIIFIYILSVQTKQYMTRTAVTSGSTVTVIFVAMYLFNLLILGKDLLGTLHFPTFYAASVVKMGTLIEKAETLITFSYTFCDLLYSSVCLLVCCRATSVLFPKQKQIKKITAGIAVIFIFVLICIFENGTVLQKLYPLATAILVPFTVGLPIVMAFLTLLKNKKD